MQIMVNGGSYSRKLDSQSEQSQPDSDKEEKFSSLLKKKKQRSKNDSEASLMMAMFQQQKSALLQSSDPVGEELAKKVDSLQATGSVMQSKNVHAVRLDSRTLNIRIASGAMAGLEIQASLNAGRLQMKLRTKSEAQYKCIERCMSKLVGKANQISSYDVEISLENKRGK